MATNAFGSNRLGRRSFIRLMGGYAVAQGLLRAEAPAEPGRPNIVFILADDHCKQAMDGYGHDFFPTPNLKRLASQGMKFNRAVVTSSICGPSRAAILTGAMGHINGFLSNEQKPFDGNQPTFVSELHRSDYQTAVVGKWHLGSEPVGFDHYDVVSPRGVGQGWYQDCFMVSKGMDWLKGGYYAKGYLTDVITDKAVQWLDERDKSKPFCLLVHHKAPHNPYSPAERHKTLYEDKTFPEPPNLFDDHKGRAPEGIAANLESSNIEEIKGLPPQKDGESREDFIHRRYQDLVRNYGRLVAALDENIGRLLEHLDTAGLTKNTIVVYLSDNGFFLGEHGFYNKMWMYEESLFVPMLMRWPGKIQPGSGSSAFVSTLDMAPTLLKAAGVTAPARMQGVDLGSLLQGKAASVRDAVYYHFHEQVGVPEQLGVRTERYKLIYYPKGTMNRWELFDLQSDPREMKNLAHDPEQAGLRKELEKQLRDLQAKYKEPSDMTIPQSGKSA